MCFETAASEMPNGAAMAVTVISPVAMRASTARRVGSARAKNTRFERLGSIFNHMVEYNRRDDWSQVLSTVLFRRRGRLRIIFTAGRRPWTPPAAAW